MLLDFTAQSCSPLYATPCSERASPLLTADHTPVARSHHAPAAVCARLAATLLRQPAGASLASQKHPAARLHAPIGCGRRPHAPARARAGSRRRAGPLVPLPDPGLGTGDAPHGGSGRLAAAEPAAAAGGPPIVAGDERRRRRCGSGDGGSGSGRPKPTRPQGRIVGDVGSCSWSGGCGRGRIGFGRTCGRAAEGCSEPARSGGGVGSRTDRTGAHAGAVA